MEAQEQGSDAMDVYFGPQLPDIAAVVTLKDLDGALAAYELIVPQDRAIPLQIWSECTQDRKLVGLKASMAIFLASGGLVVPREFQLRAAMELCCGVDALIDVGTGYGKTFCMVLPALLFPDMVTLVVSPLKKLQEMQVLEFRKYGLNSLAINEDTPHDKALWKDIAAGSYSVLVVTAEQFFVDRGHWPRMARLINKRDFSSKIKFLFVDEAHCIYTFGSSLYGQPPYRPGWAYLSDLRAKLGSRVSVAALSGTLPKHIKSVVRETLQFDDEALCDIKLSCNRPNIAYAKHAIVGNLTDYRNLDFLISDLTGSTQAGRVRMKTIVFHDRILDAVAAKEHQEKQLVAANRGKGVIRHYHAGMSQEYLTAIYDDFRDPAGTCEILHATECASTGLDIRDVRCVVQYGLPRDMTTLQQRAGRPGRDGISHSVWLLLYEPFALKMDLEPARKAQLESDVPLDPDRPVSGKLKPKAPKTARIGVSIYELVQNEEPCIRGGFATYNGDNTADAHRCTGPFCCNGKVHKDKAFDYTVYFPSQLLYLDAATGIIYKGDANDPERVALDPPSGTKRKKGKGPTIRYRPIPYRASLSSRLEEFRHNEWMSMNDLRALRHPSFILTNKQITLIARIHPNKLTSPSVIIEVLGEDLKGSDWETNFAQKIFDIIKKFDEEVGVLVTQEKEKQNQRKKRAKIAEAVTIHTVNENLQRRFEEDSDQRARAIATQTTQRFALQDLPSSSVNYQYQPPQSGLQQLLALSFSASPAMDPKALKEELKMVKAKENNMSAFEADNLRLQRETEARIRAQLAALRGFR